MICDVCQKEEAALLLGNLENGDQTAFCVPDFARFGLQSALGLLPREEVLEQVGAKPTAPVQVPVAGPDGASRPKRAVEAKPKPEPPPESPEGPPEVAAAIEDE